MNHKDNPILAKSNELLLVLGSLEELKDKLKIKTISYSDCDEIAVSFRFKGNRYCIIRLRDGLYGVEIFKHTLHEGVDYKTVYKVKILKQNHKLKLEKIREYFENASKIKLGSEQK